MDGSTSLRDLVTQLRWQFPREYGVETLAGFLLVKLGHIPAEGETVEFEGRRFAVVKMEGQRIAQVRVDPIAEEPTEDEPVTRSQEMAGGRR
jgi:CBS domain containing-hemolysin-like protein